MKSLYIVVVTTLANELQLLAEMQSSTANTLKLVRISMEITYYSEVSRRKTSK